MPAPPRSPLGVRNDANDATLPTGSGDGAAGSAGKPRSKRRGLARLDSWSESVGLEFQPTAPGQGALAVPESPKVTPRSARRKGRMPPASATPARRGAAVRVGPRGAESPRPPHSAFRAGSPEVSGMFKATLRHAAFKASVQEAVSTPLLDRFAPAGGRAPTPGDRSVDVARRKEGLVAELLRKADNARVNAEYGEAVECLKEAAWLAPPASRHTVSNALRSCRHKLVALSQERESQKHVPSMVRTLDFEGTEGLQEAIATIDAIAWNDESPVREARAPGEAGEGEKVSPASDASFSFGVFGRSSPLSPGRLPSPSTPEENVAGVRSSVEVDVPRAAPGPEEPGPPQAGEGAAPAAGEEGADDDKTVALGLLGQPAPASPEEAAAGGVPSPKGLLAQVLGTILRDTINGQAAKPAPPPLGAAGSPNLIAFTPEAQAEAPPAPTDVASPEDLITFTPEVPAGGAGPSPADLIQFTPEVAPEPAEAEEPAAPAPSPLPSPLGFDAMFKEVKPRYTAKAKGDAGGHTFEAFKLALNITPGGTVSGAHPTMPSPGAGHRFEELDREQEALDAYLADDQASQPVPGALEADGLPGAEPPAAKRVHPKTPTSLFKKGPKVSLDLTPRRVPVSAGRKPKAAPREAAPAADGSVIVLEPVKATRTQQELHGEPKILTPVRRSARKARAQGPSESDVSSVLHFTGFSYAPNPAIRLEEAEDEDVVIVEEAQLTPRRSARLAKREEM